MKNLNKRQLDILDLVVHGDFKCNRDILCDHFGVSSKTLSNDISKINIALEDYESMLRLKREVYTFKTEYPKMYWINTIKLNRTMSEDDLMAARLIFAKQTTLLDFASEQYISKSKLDKLLTDYKFKHVRLVKIRRKGFVIEGTEFDKMLEISAIIFRYIDQFNYYNSINELLKQVFQIGLEPEKIKRAIARHQKIIKMYNITSDREITRLFVICELMEYRNKTIGDYQEQLESCFVVEESELTKAYLSSIVYEVLTSENIRFEENSQIYKAFLIHLEKVVLMQENPYDSVDILKDIPGKFRRSYHTAEQLLTALERRFDFKYDESELSYIAVYIQTLINLRETFNRKRVLVVCQYGMSVSSYIQVQLENEFGDELEIDSCSINDFHHRELDDDVIIITTIDSLNSENSIHISPLPDEKELLQMIINLRQKFVQIRIESLLNLEICRYIDCKSMEELELIIDHDLVENALVRTPYLQLYKERTKAGLVNIDGLIIVHADPKEVYTNQLLSYNLQTPFKFQGKTLEHVLVFAVNEQFLRGERELVKKIYQMLMNDDNVDLIKSAKNINQLKWFIKNKVR